jgi:hypothetical protein
MQGIAPVLIIIRVACGLSKMPTGFICSVARLDSRHASPQVRIKFSVAAYSDVGQCLAGGNHVSQQISTESIDTVGKFTSV